MNQSQRNPTNTQILIVDDMPDNLDMLSRTLESEEYKLLAAPSGEVALRIAAHVQPDLILLDIMMPTLDGFETCRRLKADACLSKIPVIFITAKNEAESIVEAARPACATISASISWYFAFSTTCFTPERLRS